MKWQKLEALDEQPIPCGAIIRCPAKYPYEQVVDFMVCKLPVEACGMSLVVATGYKSGLILVSLPAESKFSEGGGISSQWLHKNWRKWVYPEAKLGDVWVALKGHPKPQLPK